MALVAAALTLGGAGMTLMGTAMALRTVFAARTERPAMRAAMWKHSGGFVAGGTGILALGLALLMLVNR